MAPWWRFPCKPKHVGAVLLILKCFNNSTFFNVVCVSWKIKCWITTWFPSRTPIPKEYSYFYYNQQIYNITTLHNTTVYKSTLLHVSTFSCHHHEVTHQCFAKLHKFSKLQLLKSQFHSKCLTSSYAEFLDYGCWIYSFTKLLNFQNILSSIKLLISTAIIKKKKLCNLERLWCVTPWWWH